MVIRCRGVIEIDRNNKKIEFRTDYGGDVKVRIEGIPLPMMDYDFETHEVFEVRADAYKEVMDRIKGYLSGEDKRDNETELEYMQRTSILQFIDEMEQSYLIKVVFGDDDGGDSSGV